MIPGAPARVIAIGAALVASALAAASITLIALNPNARLLPEGWGVAGYDAAFALLFAVVGALVAVRQPGNVIGWLLLLEAVLSGIQTVTDSYAAYALASAGAPGYAVAAWIPQWIWIASLGVFAVTLTVFPDGRPASRRWRAVVLSAPPVTFLITLLWALATPPAAIPGPPILDPLGLGPDHPLHTVAGMSALALAVYLVLGGASLYARMRHAGAVERQQIKWVALAAAIAGPAFAASLVTALVPTDPAIAKAAQVSSIATVLLFPVAVGVAILRYRLYDIDVLINRTLVYGSLTASLAGAYVASVLLLQTLLRPLTGGSDIAVAVSTLAVVALFQPLRRRIQDWVDRRFYRSRYDAQRTIDAFTSRLRAQVDLGDLERELVGVVAETVRPRHASLWLHRGD
ncbi:MAG: hypothetical protein ACRDGT_05190 [Candidatus Limnocylindria bacterium]